MGKEPVLTVFVVYFADFSEPLQLSGPKKKSDFAVNEDGVAMILSMGFSQEQAVRALKATVSIF